MTTLNLLKIVLVGILKTTKSATMTTENLHIFHTSHQTYQQSRHKFSTFKSFLIWIWVIYLEAQNNMRHPVVKEYKEEAQCAQKVGRMLVFVICGFIKNFLPNYYFILHVHHVKSFKMRHVRSLYFNFSVRYS